MIQSSIENFQPEQVLNNEQKPIVSTSAQVSANAMLPACAVSETYLMDCIEGMKHYPDKWFDLAVVDPPYGIGWNAMQTNWDEGRVIKGWKRKFKNYKQAEWDVKPTDEYWCELFRVSKEQIIWGANHFSLPPTKCIIFWDKETGDFSFGDGEIAWCSIGGSIKKYTFRWAGMLKGKNGNYREDRFHPTQKPIPLYDWIFSTYAEPGMKILDTHLGSGSSRVAAHKNKLNFVGFEIDKEYFDKQEKRFADYVSQLTLF